jgi:hypothetical protein
MLRDELILEGLQITFLFVLARLFTFLKTELHSVQHFFLHVTQVVFFLVKEELWKRRPAEEQKLHVVYHTACLL